MATYTDVFTGSIVDASIASYTSITLNANIQLTWPAYTPTIGGPFAVAARNIDVTATSSGYELMLPQGNYGAVGVDLLITNRGSVSFLVADTFGANAINLGPGASYYFYLQDNTTVAGTWKNFQFGTGTSSADAASLAGYGLNSLGGKLNETILIKQFSSLSQPILNTDRGTAFIWTGGSGTITLPASSSLSSGWFIYFRNQGTGTITLLANGSDLINGLSSTQFNIGVSGLLSFDSATSQFFTLGVVQSQNFAFSSATYDVDAIPTTTFNLVSGAPIIQKYRSINGTRTQNLTVSLPAITQLYAFINATNLSNVTLSFQIVGSSQPPISVAVNTQSFVVSDGVSLYVLNSSAYGSVQLNDGTAAAPTLAFLGDLMTGIYRPGFNQLGISVSGAQALNFNGTDPSNPIIQSSALAVFKAVDGGLI